MKTKTVLAAGKCVLAFTFVLVQFVVAPRAQAQTFKVVYNFTGGSDGGNPLDGLTSDGAGNLYGTTYTGGVSGNGTVFKFSGSSETVVHNFAGGSDGANPEGGLIRDAQGYFFGTTTAGGASGAGTVFAVSAAGKEVVLYTFAGGADGSNPQAGLILDASGNLYGTTSAGGANGNGTVFKLSHPTKGSKWTETILYSFGTGSDGAVPLAAVKFDKAGNLYGTTSAGGSYGYGTIFQLTPAGSSWTETILHDFQDADDGAVPYGGLIADKSGNFYGSATEGGTGGGGTIFELTQASGDWTFTVLYSNPGWGISGSYRNLTLDASGNLYGTTHCDGADSAGTVYKLSQESGSWTYTSLYVFTGGTDGQYSYSNPVVEGDRVFGTTRFGGANGGGVVWEITL
ncbi:MAG: choice-of-anchor tandem repeat GloVer-containing protein [Candidatus Sulfotelmatobacter sp.]|jgi:uncharacterized repeat protein (TIGR03803 family)